MLDLVKDLINFSHTPTMAAYLRGLILVTVGFFTAKIAASTAYQLAMRELTSARSRTIKRTIFWLLFGLFCIAALREAGFKLSVLLGAAGILSVALGFASQTSASNFISGLFLTLEKPFSVGDTIRVGQTTGEVLSIDLLSVKLRTFDNLMVRIPNETLIKTEVTTLTRFPIRRYDLQVGVAYKEDLTHVQEILMKVADEITVCLDEPKPMVFMNGFGDSAIQIQLSAWAKRENFFELRNTLLMDVKKALDTAGIEIPFPHRSLYVGEASKAMPVRIVHEAHDSDAK